MKEIATDRFRTAVPFYGAAVLGSLVAAFFPTVSAATLLQENEGLVTDPLHGISVRLKPFWSLRIVPYGYLMHDAYNFILICGVRYEGGLNQVIRKWLRERGSQFYEASPFGFANPQFYIKSVKGMVLLVGDGLGYPFYLDPNLAITWGTLSSVGMMPPHPYREVTLLIPGRKAALLISLFFPADPQRAKPREMVEIIRSFRLLPPEERISWREEKIFCSETGMVASTIHIPEGFEFAGTAIKMDKTRFCAFLVKKGDALLRNDFINFVTSVLQTPFGGNGQTILTINGQSFPLPQPLFISSKEEMISFLLALWQGETGHQWNVVTSQDLPESPFAKEQRERIQMEGQKMALLMGSQMGFAEMKKNLVATGSGKRRFALVDASLSVGLSPSAVASSQMIQGSLRVHLIQVPDDPASAGLETILGAVARSLDYNPQWSLWANEAWGREHIEETRMVRRMMKESQEFNSRMATAWTNLLTDQTYVKDPETNEIFRVHKYAWETGDFWREPVFQDLIVKGVERGSELEQMLQQEGWKRLSESLEGFND